MEREQELRIKARIVEIAALTAEKITFETRPDGLAVNFDSFALPSFIARKISELAEDEMRPCIITIQSVEHPLIQVQI